MTTKEQKKLKERIKTTAKIQLTFYVFCFYL